MTDMLSQDEIDQLLTAISSGDTEPEDFKSINDNRKIKIYDFKRPDKFSTEATRTIKMMHETFARQTTTTLSAQLRTLAHVHVATVEQLTYEEFIRSIPAPTTLALINMDPLPGSAVLEIDPSITFSIIDRLFGGKGQSIKIQRELTDIEGSVMEGIIVKILANMREAWNTVIDLRPRLVTVEPVVSKLSTQYWFTSVRRSSTTQHLAVLKEKLAAVEVDVAAEVGSLDISVSDVLSLGVGDIIRLPGVQVGDPFTLSIGNRKKFYCQPGVVGKRVAVQLLSKTEDITEEDFENLSEEGENYYE